MKDELDGLSDEALSEAFAVEVAGWVMRSAYEGTSTQAWFDREGHFVEDDHGFWINPAFATSADAVMPWLEKAYVEYGKHLTDATGKPGWFMRVFIGNAHGEYVGAPTFARAACISLLLAVRASRAQKP